MGRSLFLPPALLGLILLTACGRVANIGKPPAFTDPQDGAEAQAMTESLQLARFPNSESPHGGHGSLWTAGGASLVAERRASGRGDILTVVIEINDKAEFQNSSGRTRSASENVGIPDMIGIPQRLQSALPEGASFDHLAGAKANSAYKGSGNISRREKLTLRVAATVTDVLPNGVLRIQGTQEVRVNNEVRELTVSGFVRPADVGRRNEIAYDRIAGARISYGGRGNITDVQQPRYGQQLADIILPY